MQWPLLEQVYSLLYTLITQYSSGTQAFITKSFLIHLAHNLHSGDMRETAILNSIFVKLYAQYNDLREMIRFALKVAIHERLREYSPHFHENGMQDDWMNGIHEILEIYALILKGIATPVHSEHSEFLKKYLLSLLKQSNIEVYYDNLKLCMRRILSKDPLLVKPVLTALVKYWPVGNLNKKIAFVFMIEMCIEVVKDELVMAEVRQIIYQQYCKCIRGDNAIVGDD